MNYCGKSKTLCWKTPFILMFYVRAEFSVIMLVSELMDKEINFVCMTIVACPLLFLIVTFFQLYA